MFVLKPLTSTQLNNLFDNDSRTIIEYFIKKSVFSQPEKTKGQKDLPIQIPKEHIEQRITQALGIESKGAGSYAIDLLDSDNKRGADVKMLSAKVDKNGKLTNGDTGETSLAQKFKSTGKDLDTMFKDEQYQIIMDQRLGIYKNKLEEVITSHNLQNIYYFIILRGGKKLYLLGMEVFLENLDKCTVKEIKIGKKEVSSVFIDNFIDGELGNVKIYKAKKRMELRLKAKNREDRGLTIEFPTELIVDEINFRDFLQDGGNINDYGKIKSKTIFK